jgi:hypothetical protein
MALGTVLSGPDKRIDEYEKSKGAKTGEKLKWALGHCIADAVTKEMGKPIPFAVAEVLDSAFSRLTVDEIAGAVDASAKFSGADGAAAFGIVLTQKIAEKKEAKK